MSSSKPSSASSHPSKAPHPSTLQHKDRPLKPFVDGADFEEVFDTPQGPLRVLAETHIFGPRLVLDELMIFPDQEERLSVGVRMMLLVVRELRIRAAGLGYRELTVVYHRIGKSRTGNTIVRTRRLT